MILVQNEYQPQEERDETDDLIELPVTGHETYFVQFSFQSRLRPMS
jgi:hypothetical protein